MQLQVLQKELESRLQVSRRFRFWIELRGCLIGFLLCLLNVAACQSVLSDCRRNKSEFQICSAFVVKRSLHSDVDWFNVADLNKHVIAVN